MERVQVLARHFLSGEIPVSAGSARTWLLHIAFPLIFHKARARSG